MTDHSIRRVPGGGYDCRCCNQTARTTKEMRAVPCGEMDALAEAKAGAAEDPCSDEAMLAFDADEDDEDA